ncbi:barstar family protein [Candidatus Sumerlaeota bacterium]|nr:barstar family protein [Candidatus Sumerlaeota bacterium]
MAAFDPEDLDRTDWKLFQNGWITMYWKLGILDEDCSWLAQNGYQIYRLDCAKWNSKSRALKELGAGLRFPDYYGQNLDALNDCLSDLEIPNNGGCAIVLLHYDKFAKVNRAVAQAILDILADRGRGFMLFGQRLATLIQSDDPNISFDCVGATPVVWNCREWYNRQRSP